MCVCMCVCVHDINSAHYRCVDDVGQGVKQLLCHVTTVKGLSGIRDALHKLLAEVHVHTCILTGWVSINVNEGDLLFPNPALKGMDGVHLLGYISN